MPGPIPFPTPNGELEPFISQESVQVALDRLVYTSSSPSASPLCWLMLVDEFLSDPDLPPTGEAREFALNFILTSQITEALTEQRLRLGLAAPKRDSSLDEELKAIHDDAQTENHELVGWAALYYRYVRVDLGLSLETLSEALHIVPRTLRRHHPYGLKALTARLTHAEWAARKRQRARRLLAELPVAAPTALYGRDDAFRSLAHFLEGPRPHHFLITGQPGIGKSSFVQQALRLEIAAGHLQYVFWISYPASVEYIGEHLAERLIPPGSKINLAEQLMVYRVAIVLDDLSLLVERSSALEGLLDDLGNAQVYLTHASYLPLSNVPAHIPLSELSREESVNLVSSLGGILAEDSQAAEDYGDFLWEATGGNPLALKLAARSLWLHDAHTLSRQSLQAIFGRSEAALTPTQRRAWYAFALFPPGRIEAEAVCRLWPSWITSADISDLLRRHLLDRAASQELICSITMAARRYIEATYQTNPETGGAIDALVGALADDTAMSWEVIEHILSASWLTVDGERARQWMMSLWNQGLPPGHWTAWRALVERHSSWITAADSDLLMAYGICARRLGEWQEAGQALEQVILETGRTGKFIEQAKAAVEQAILLEYEGRYEKALSLLDRAERAAARYGDQTLAYRIRLEQAQIALDAGEGAEGSDFLAGLPVSTRLLALRSESSLRGRDLTTALGFARQAIELAGADPVNLGRLYPLLGRILAQQGDISGAQLALQAAITLLEQAADCFALARTRTNLGALLIKTKNYDEASRLLTEAESVQVSLKDQVGLESTRHNLLVLRRSIGG